MVSDNFGLRRPDGSPRININPEPSQPFDLQEPERTLEEVPLRQRINDILLPDDDTIPDWDTETLTDEVEDPCCAEAREELSSWMFEYAKQQGANRLSDPFFTQMLFDVAEAVANGDEGWSCAELQEKMELWLQRGNDKEKKVAQMVLDTWDACSSRSMGHLASDDPFEAGWNAILKYSIYEDKPDDAPFERLVSTFSGMGAPETAAMRVGAKPALSIDGWDESIRTLNENYPGEHKQIWMGGEGGSVEDVLGHIHDATTGADSWAYHGSPPCTDISSANPNCDPDKAMEMMRFNDALMSGMRAMENPPSLMTTEQAKEMRPLLLGGDHGLSQEFMDAVRSSPTLESGMFGSPTVRERMYAIEGSMATPQIRGRDNYRSINDMFPDMAGEWEESENRPAQLAHLARLGKVGQDAFNMLAEPTLSMVGSVNPGKEGAPWNDEKQGFAWKHIHPTRRAVPSVTHHRPALTHTRKLSRPEVMQIQGWTPEEAKGFNFPQKDNQGYQHTEKTRQNIIDTQLGNTLNPNIMENIFRNVQPRRVA
jgi:site-specific DNA-cytosine methylase